MTAKTKTAGKTAMKVYTFNQFDHELRVGEINGEPWFVAKDVAKALNITWSGHTLDQIPEEWKGVLNFKTPGGNQDLTVISEAGLYKLAFRCQSSEIADRFTNKVASEILPSIRKTGRYESSTASPHTEQGLAVRPRRRRGLLVDAELTNLLWLIGESLWHGDLVKIALELGVSRQSVYSVLNGYTRSSRILTALYQKARERRECSEIYNQPGLMADRLLGISRESMQGNTLPPVQIGGKRGGQIGNQNARKVWRKEGK